MSYCFIEIESGWSQVVDYFTLNPGAYHVFKLSLTTLPKSQTYNRQCLLQDGSVLNTYHVPVASCKVAANPIVLPVLEG